MRVVVPKDLGTQPIPAGVYRAIYKKHTLSMSQQNNPVMWTTFTVLSQGPSSEVNTVGRVVTSNLTFTEDSMWRANQLYRAVTGRDLEPGEYNAEELAEMIANAARTKEVVIVVDVDEYQGTKRNRITEIRPAPVS